MSTYYHLELGPVVADLKKLTIKQLVTLSKRSRVPFPTLYKVRTGYTDNPRLQTLTRLAPYLRRMVEEQESAR